MPKIFTLKAKLFFLFLILSTTLSAQEVTRVISLASSITDNIYLVGGKDKLVGCTSYCMPAVKDGKEVVGSAIEVNVEKILALNPDVVLAMKLTKVQDVESLKRLGLKVVVMETPKSFDEICAQTLRIAQLIGKTEQAQKIVAEAREKVEIIQKKAKAISPSKVFFQIGSNPIFTVLQNTFMDDYITFCNAQNIAGGLKQGTMTRENVLLENPDVIIIAEMGGFGQTEKKVWNSYTSLSAVKQNKVFLISSEMSCSPSPMNFVHTLEAIYNDIIQ